MAEPKRSTCRDLMGLTSVDEAVHFLWHSTPWESIWELRLLHDRACDRDLGSVSGRVVGFSVLTWGLSHHRQEDEASEV